MIVAKQKRKENIAEYLLYMWQVEDLIRANQFDIDSIRRTVIAQYDQPGCEIVVPSKSQRDRRANLAEILSITSSTTSIAAMLTSLINSLK